MEIFVFFEVRTEFLNIISMTLVSNTCCIALYCIVLYCVVLYCVVLYYLSIKQGTHVRENLDQGIFFYFCLPDCWLVVSMHPEGPATGHLDTGFLGFPLSSSKC
jgi:hypothetical protein